MYHYFLLCRDYRKAFGDNTEVIIQYYIECREAVKNLQPKINATLSIIEKTKESLPEEQSLKNNIEGAETHQLKQQVNAISLNIKSGMYAIQDLKALTDKLDSILVVVKDLDKEFREKTGLHIDVVIEQDERDKKRLIELLAGDFKEDMNKEEQNEYESMLIQKLKPTRGKLEILIHEKKELSEELETKIKVAKQSANELTISNLDSPALKKGMDAFQAIEILKSRLEKIVPKISDTKLLEDELKGFHKFRESLQNMAFST